MAKEKTIETQIGGYTSNLLRDYFGKSPISAYVTISKPFITVQLRGFLSTIEKILLKQDDTKRVLETRDLLLEELRSDIKLELWKIAELEIQEVYADRNLEDHSGTLIMVTNQEEDNLPDWPADVDKDAFYEEIIAASIKGQKKPEHTEIQWLSKRVIMIKRRGIFVELEKELIKSGFNEALRIAKRPLEYRLFPSAALEKLLYRKVTNVYVDGNFEKDKGYMVLVLESVDQPTD